MAETSQDNHRISEIDRDDDWISEINQDDARLSDTNRDDAWKKLAHSFPALYSAIENNGAITVGEFLQIKSCAETNYAQLPLSVRALHCLDLELPEHKSVSDILSMPLARLAGLRNAGVKTVREILDAVAAYARQCPSVLIDAHLKNLLMFYTEQIAKEQWDVIEAQLESDEQREVLLKIMDIAEVIGADMVAATFSSSFPISVLLPSLTNFIREQKVYDTQAEKLQAMVNALPSERKVLLVKPFAYAWPGRSTMSEFEDAFDETMTFKDLVRQDTHYSDEELNALKSFLSWCSTSIETEIAKAIDSCFTDNKRREITSYRAQGKTLEEIGTLYNITRERVRQIEKKSVCRFPVKTAENILMLISATQRGAEILPAQDIANYCGDDSILFLYLLRNAEGVKHYRYAKNLDAFILGNAPLEEEHVHSFLDELPDRIDAADLKTYLARASEKGLPPELIEHQIRTDYHYIESIHTWQRGTLNLRQMSREILKEFDPDGIHITVHEELQLFREKLYARFGSEIRISEGDRALSIIIADVGMLRDRSTYVSEREHILPDELLERIREFVDQGDKDVYMFSTLYETFKPELLQAGVDNRYFLQGILRYEWNQFYSFSRDCLSKGGRSTSIYGTVELYIKNAGRYVSISEIRETFPGVTDVVLNYALAQKHIIACNGKYIHVENLHLTEQHIRDLKQTLDMLLADGRAHHSRELFSLASTYNGGLLDKIGVIYQSELFSIVAYLYSSGCIFSRPWIAVRGSAGEETINQLRGRTAEADEEGKNSLASGVIYEGSLIDKIMTVLQQTATEMTIKEITDELIRQGLYQTNSPNPSLTVYQTLNNAITGKGSRNAVLRKLLGTRIDPQGHRLFYPLDPSKPIFAESGQLKALTGEVAPPVMEVVVDTETASRWNLILSEEFEDGLRLNGMRLRKFRSIYEERYHDAVEPDDEKLIAMLKQVGEFRDERIYAKRDAGQSALMDIIQQDILQTLTSGASCVYPQQLFEKYKEKLAEQLSVYTADSFKAMLLASTNRHFSVYHGTICLHGKSANIMADVVRLFQECYEPITYTQMSEQLWYIPMDRIKYALVREKSIVLIDQETYFYAPNFPISTHELAALQQAMRRQIEDKDFLVARSLRELMKIYCPNAVMDTANWKDWGVRNVMAWLLRDQFDFNGAIICEKGAGMDTHMVFHSYCKSHDRITMDELKNLCSQLDVSGIYWDSVLAEMVRISRDEFLSKRLISFDSESTDRVLEQACPGDYMPLKDFTLFMSLPGVAVPWNGFLLESYLRDYSRVFRLEQASPVEHTPIGAMVRRISPLLTNRDLLIDVLVHDNSWHSPKEAMDVLVDGGYRTQRLMGNDIAEIIKAAQMQQEKLKSAEK